MSQATPPAWAIEVRDLTLAFGDRRALDGVSFAVGPGEVFGVLGPNGAGKTTTVRVLNGLLVPDGGLARVWGRDPQREGEALRRMTGVLTEAPSLYERLTGRDNLRFFATLHRLAGAVREARVQAALEAVGLADRADDRAGAYSKGMKQRLAIARAIVHEPAVLFLDEPTGGLDPESSEQINRLIRHLATRGTTIYLCTHRLNEAERLCHRFALFDRGHVLAQGSKAELAARVGAAPGVRLTFDGPHPALGTLPGELGRTSDGPSWRLTLDDMARVPDVVAASVAAGARVRRVEPFEPTLEDLYFALMRGTPPEGA